MMLIKKTFFFFLSSFLLLVTNSFAQKGAGCPEDIVPKYSENKNWGYADLFGQWVIEPIYSKVSPFVEGKAIVQKGLLSGVIDCAGNVILPCNYEKLTNFRNGKAWARENGQWGLVGVKGQKFQMPQFNEINPILNTELAWVRKSDFWGLFNEERNSFICKPQFKIAQTISLNASLVKVDSLFGVLNHVNCGYLLPLELTRVKKLAPHDIMFEQQGKWGVFNDVGKILLNPTYDTLFMKNEELLQVVQNGKHGLTSLKGKKILAVEYDSIAPFQDNFFMIKKNGMFGYANRLGKELIIPQYEDARSFSNKQAVVKKAGKWGVVDYYNKFLLNAQNESIEKGKGNFYAISQQGKWFLYDFSFKKITDVDFEKIISQDTLTALRVVKDGRLAYYNILTKAYLSADYYDKASAFDRGFALVTNKGKKGILAANGTQVLACAYDTILLDNFQTKLVFRVVEKGKHGIADQTGKFIIPTQYDQLSPALPNYLKVKKEGKFGIMRTSGEAVTECIYDYMSTSADLPNAPNWPAIVSVKLKFGLITEKGEELVAPKAKEIRYVGNGIYFLLDGKNKTLVNSLGKTIAVKYDDLGYFGDGLVPFKLGEKWGYSNSQGEEKIKAQFEQAGTFAGKIAVAMLKGRWGVIDRMGKTLYPFDYDRYEVDENGYHVLYKGTSKYTLWPDGSLR